MGFDFGVRLFSPPPSIFFVFFCFVQAKRKTINPLRKHRFSFLSDILEYNITKFANLCNFEFPSYHALQPCIQRPPRSGNSQGARGVYENENIQKNCFGRVSQVLSQANAMVLNSFLVNQYSTTSIDLIDPC